MEHYRGALPMLDGQPVTIIYETCDGNETPIYRIAEHPGNYSGQFEMRGQDRQLVLSVNRVALFS